MIWAGCVMCCCPTYSSCSFPPFSALLAPCSRPSYWQTQIHTQFHLFLHLLLIICAHSVGTLGSDTFWSSMELVCSYSLDFHRAPLEVP